MHLLPGLEFCLWDALALDLGKFISAIRLSDLNSKVSITTIPLYGIAVEIK